MKQKISKTIIKNFKHELLYTILIPFYIGDNEGYSLNRSIKKEDLKKGDFISKKVIEKNSQFFDYIENIYMDNDNVNYFEVSENIIKDLELLLFRIGKQKIQKIFIYSAIDSMAILGIEIKFKRLNTIEEIYKQRKDINASIKFSTLKDYIQNLFNLDNNKKILYFDSYTSKNKKTDMMRFHSFTTLISHSPNKPLSDLIKKNIASYFLNELSIEFLINKNSFYETHPFVGGSIYCSSEGILFIYEKNIYNKSLTNKFMNNKKITF